LSRAEVSFCKPFRIIVIPDQAVAAYFYSMGFGETYDFVTLLEIKALGGRPNRPPLQRVLWLDHIELVSEGRGISSF